MCHMQHSPFAADTDMDIKEYIIKRVRPGFIVGATLCFFDSPVCFFVKG